MKFAKDSIEWGLFGATWKFYQKFREDDKEYTEDEIADLISGMGQAMSDMLKPLEGKELEYLLAKDLLMVAVNDITRRIDARTGGKKYE